MLTVKYSGSLSQGESLVRLKSMGESLGSSAPEIRGVVRAAAARIPRHLGIWTKRTRPHRFSGNKLRRHDLIRRLVILHPALQRGVHVSGFDVRCARRRPKTVRA